MSVIHSTSVEPIPLPPVLQYAPAAVELRSPAWLRALALAISLPALALIFLDFAYGTSPLDVFMELWRRGWFSEWPLMLVAGPFFLAIPIAGIKLRALITPRVSAAERVLIWIAVTISAAGSAYFEIAGLIQMGMSQQWSFDRDVISMLIGMAILPIGAGLLLWKRRSLPSAHTRLAALLICYLSNASMCLIEFHGSSHPGWWVTLVLTPILAIELVGIIFRSFLTRATRAL